MGLFNVANKIMEIIQLTHPVQHDEKTIKELEIRRPKVRDHIWLEHQESAALREGKRLADVEKDYKLYARLTDVSEEVIGKLDMQDWGKLRKFYLGCVTPSASSDQKTETD